MAMNILRFCGDMTHSAAIAFLLFQLRFKKNAVDFSLKTQELYFVMFITRYLDLFTTFYSYYNSLLKISFISTSIYIMYLMRCPCDQLRHRIDFRHKDTFPAFRVVLPILVLSIISHHRLIENLWTFSIMLEAVAMMPQIFIVFNSHLDVQNPVKIYILLIWLYRGVFYPLNWVYRSYHELYYQHHFLVYICAFIEFILLPLPWVLYKFGIHRRNQGDNEDREDLSGDGIEYVPLRVV